MKTRSLFTFFGGISLLAGVIFAACFYKAGFGISYPVFVFAAILLINKVVSHWPEPDGSHHTWRGSLPYEVGAMLLAVSTMLTASSFFYFFNTVGILLLLEAAFLKVIFDSTEISFERRFLHMLLLPFYAIGQLASPFVDSFTFFKRTKLFKNEKSRQIIIGLIIAVPAVIVVCVLLGNADMVFLRLFSDIADKIFFSADPLLIILLVLFIFIVCCCIINGTSQLQSAINAKQSADVCATPHDRSLTAITVTVCLTCIYLIFCVIQVLYLFAGGSITLPDGYTYTEYAHQGFFELLAVTIINFFIVLLCTGQAKHSLVLRISLVVMTACTYVMTASAAMRMLLYIDAYYLTFLRVLVLWFLFVNTLLITGAMIRILHPAFPLFGYVTAVVASCFIIFSFSRPDYYIAAYNTTYDENMCSDDIHYLCSLSADAAPVLIEYYNDNKISNSIDNYAISHLEHFFENVHEKAADMGIRGWNLSLYTADKELSAQGLGGTD